MGKELSPRQRLQDERDLDKIELLHRLVDRKALDDECARVVDQVEHRMANGQPVPTEEFELFCKIVNENPANRGDSGGRLEILRKKVEAHNKEAISIENERINDAEKRSDYSRMEGEIRGTLETAVLMGDTEKIEECKKQLETLESMKDGISEPAEVEKVEQISEEERAIEYEKIDAYGEKLEKELKEDELQKYNENKPLSIADIKRTNSNMKMSDIQKGNNDIKHQLQLESTRENNQNDIEK